MKKYSQSKGLGLVFWLLILVSWQLAFAGSDGQGLNIPSITEIWRAFRVLCQEGYAGIPLLIHLRASFVRLFLALLSATMLALPLGILSSFSSVVHYIVQSLVNFVRPIPPLAYYPLLIMLVGISDTSKIILLFIAAFAPLYLAVLSGIEQVRSDYILTAESLGASQLMIMRKVIWPSVLANFIVGLRTAFGFAYTTLVSAEMTAAESGLGWLVIDASRYLKIDVVFVGIVLMGLTGLIFDRILDYIEKQIIFWKGQG
ncbi:ABC transporter permease [Aerococcus urinae]|uniref:ABC transporter permease n=1 Tax=Aerococcus TaxID=1375 RepID=UPI0018A746B9|nr:MULTISPECIES: ABC transporter permease [Aerococcus]MCY3036168.1 ABC transporter permease [Aerococcus sp. Group 2]MDK6520182.1 ABC transporter permease [Aerococcus urinae]